MSPKRITQSALSVGGVSLIGFPLMWFVRPDLGWLNLWPLLGLGLAMLLIVVAYLRGAYLVAQKRVHMVDMLNDCYQGNNTTR
jgi:hypothetical protein